MPPAQNGDLQHASVAIRDFQPEDYRAIVEIGNLLYPEHPETVEELRYWDEHFDRSRYVDRRYVAVDPGTNAVVASGHYNHMPWAFHPQRFWMWIGVHPGRHRQGIGGAMFDRILEDLWRRDAISLKASARENMPESLAFLQRRGFREVMRAWESRFDLTTFDPARFAEEAKVPPSIQIVTLADEMARDPESLRRVYDLVNIVAPDAPRTDPYTPPGFEMFRDDVLGSPGALPEAFLLAKDGASYVGESDLRRSDAMPGELITGFTGVLREYRGRGIALALKLRAIEYARGHGYRRIRTWNSTLNAPMLGINVKLGFVKQPAWIHFEKTLAGEAR